ncbi:MAG TPA: NTP transferase domain-containing protein [Desulfosporosinus sp.]|nr:NTP transferase domain-containing protein [Desulfosporosinus sp.]
MANENQVKAGNAVILAAGTGTRLVPLSFEKPKGQISVKGEILIERQIRQLNEAGISDITVVVGYLKAQFLYLADKYGVKLIENNDFRSTGSAASLACAKDVLKNTFVVFSHHYFIENVFKSAVYRSTYPSQILGGYGLESAFTADENGKITAIEPCRCDEPALVGPLFITKEFSEKLKSIFNDYGETKKIQDSVEELLAKNLDLLELYTKEYDGSPVYTLNTIEDLRAFDPDYNQQNNSLVIANIISIFKCSEQEIVGFEKLHIGNTNSNFFFEIKGKRYIYRHPGAGTEVYINRRCEAYAEVQAKKRGLDKTVVFVHPEEGWKIAHCVEGCWDLSCSSDEDIVQAMGFLKKLHEAKIPCEWEFNPIKNAQAHIDYLTEQGIRDFSEYGELREKIFKLYEYTEGDGYEKVLCHNDTWYMNFLRNGKLFQMIDWEYAGLNDPASDVATFSFTYERVFDKDKYAWLCETYAGRSLKPEELRHFEAYRAIISYYWLIWAVWQEAQGVDAAKYTELMALRRETTEEYLAIALPKYEVETQLKIS